MQTELSGHFQQILHQNDRRNQVINSVLAVALVIVLVWAAIVAWRNAQQPKIESIMILADSVRVLSPTELCPGESLHLAYRVSIEGLGIVIWDDAVQYQDTTVKFSDARRDIIEGPVTLSLEDEWQIAARPEMAIDGKREWAPGTYVRFIAISASNSYISRYVQPAILKIPFSIRQGCMA